MDGLVAVLTKTRFVTFFIMLISNYISNIFPDWNYDLYREESVESIHKRKLFAYAVPGKEANKRIRGHWAKT